MQIDFIDANEIFQTIHQKHLNMDSSINSDSLLTDNDYTKGSPSPMKSSTLDFTDLLLSPSNTSIEDIDNSLQSSGEKNKMDKGSDRDTTTAQSNKNKRSVVAVSGIRRGFTNDLNKKDTTLKSSSTSSNYVNSLSRGTALSGSASASKVHSASSLVAVATQKDARGNAIKANGSDEKNKSTNTVNMDISPSSSEPRRRRSIDDLYRDAERRMSRLEKMQQELPSECTFKPSVNPNKIGNERSKMSNSDGDGDGDKSEQGNLSIITGNGTETGSASSHSYHEKLYHDSIALKQKMEEKAKRLLESEKQQTTFKPNITERARRSASPGAGRRHELLYKKSIEHKEVIEKTKERILEEEKAATTFKPVITERARRSASPGRNRHEELYKASAAYKEKLENKRKEFDKEFSFAPKINNNYPIIGKAMNTPVWERLSVAPKNKDNNHDEDREDSKNER